MSAEKAETKCFLNQIKLRSVLPIPINLSDITLSTINQLTR